MFPPSDPIIVWILWGVVALAALATLIATISLVFALFGTPDDVHDIDIDPNAPLAKDRKTTKK